MSVDWGYRFHDLRHWDKPVYDDGRQWEVGTYPYCAVRMAAAGLEMLNRCGTDEIWSRIERLRTHLQNGLDGTPYSVEVFPNGNVSAIMRINGPRVTELHPFLTKRRIYTSLREGGIRVSPHFYNTTDDIDTLLNAIQEFSAS
jgi:selenocysteine lyase/cysteine desulfurase